MFILSPAIRFHRRRIQCQSQRERKKKINIVELFLEKNVEDEEK